MSDGATLASLAHVFMQLSLLAFGGTNSVLPEMQRQVVEVHHWLTAQEFAALFALAQAAPGPNTLVVTLIGWHVAALPGALITTAGPVMAGAALLIETTSISWGTAAIAAIATVPYLFTRLHPLLVLSAAAAQGASGVLT